MKDLARTIRESFRDYEYAEVYADSFQDTYLATQIKVLREQRELTQGELGELIGTTQGGISRIEDSTYSSWSVKTLKKLSRALRVRLRISFEEYGTVPDDVLSLSKNSLMRAAHENDMRIFPEKMTTESSSKIRSISDFSPQYRSGIDTSNAGGGSTLGRKKDLGNMAASAPMTGAIHAGS